jgi:uncharacterized ion transporter superfamily protein YfcC
VPATTRRFPDSLVLIFGMIVAAQLATYVLTPGSFDFALDEAGAPTRRVVAGSFHPVAADPLPWHAFLTRIPAGLEASAEIIFFVFIVGGAIGVLRATGAIDALLGSALRRLGGRPVVLVAGMLTLLAVGSSTIGMAEEYMPFVPILVTMCLALRFDAVVALGIIYAGAGIGYGCAALNPFTVMIAKDIAGLSAGSGQAFRWVFLAVCIPVCAQHILAYAARVRRDPARSLVHDVDYSTGYEMPHGVALTARRALLLLAGVALIGVFVWGSKVHGWFLVELAGLFLGLSLLCGLIAPLSPNRVAAEFCKGAGELSTTALLIGFARTIEVLLVEGRVIHTVVHGVAQPLEALGAEGAALGMLAVQSATNFLIPSGSGQAYVTMPIMAPLSDITGVPRHTAVLAYQIGDGFMNMIVPTNALLMGMLGLARIPFERWLRFVVPLLAKLFVVAAVAVVVAVRWGDRLGM